MASRRRASRDTLSPPLAGPGRPGDEWTGKAGKPIAGGSACPAAAWPSLVASPPAAGSPQVASASPLVRVVVPLFTLRERSMTRARRALILSAAVAARACRAAPPRMSAQGCGAVALVALAPPALPARAASPPPPPLALALPPLPLASPVGTWSSAPPWPKGSSSMSSRLWSPPLAWLIRWPPFPSASVPTQSLAATSLPSAPGSPIRRLTFSAAAAPLFFHLLALLSKAAVTTTLVRGASPPPVSLRLHGCLPDSIRRSACEPAVVGAPHGCSRRLARR